LKSDVLQLCERESLQKGYVPSFVKRLTGLFDLRPVSEFDLERVLLKVQERVIEFGLQSVIARQAE
jgi:hypothetical protein